MTSYTTPPTLSTSVWSKVSVKPTDEPVHHQEPVNEDCDCAICMEKVEDCDKLACGHAFCSGCIDQWLATNSRCPLCRKNPVFEAFKANSVDGRECTNGKTMAFNAYAFQNTLPRAVQLSCAMQTSESKAARLEQRLASIMMHVDLLEKEMTEHFQSEDGGALLDLMNGVSHMRRNSSTVKEMFAKVARDFTVAHAAVARHNQEMCSDWRRVPEGAQEDFINSSGTVSKELKGIVTTETDDNGKEYFIIHPEFDVPESICKGGDPRERQMNGKSCHDLDCPCRTFVSKILLFEDPCIKFNGVNMYPDQITLDTQGVHSSYGSSLVIAHGKMFRSDVVSWDTDCPQRRLFPNGAIVEPMIRKTRVDENALFFAVEELHQEHSLPNPSSSDSNSPPTHANDAENVWTETGCPWRIGDRVQKTHGVGSGLFGYIVHISTNGRKIRVSIEGSETNWNMQSWHNYDLANE